MFTPVDLSLMKQKFQHQFLKVFFYFLTYCLLPHKKKSISAIFKKKVLNIKKRVLLTKLSLRTFLIFLQALMVVTKQKKNFLNEPSQKTENKN